MARVLTPIVDRNGKATRVWKNPDAKTRELPDVGSSSKFGVAGAYDYAASVAEEDEYMKEVILPILTEFKSRYGEPECGRTRAVFDMGNGYVIKVPIDYEGMMASSNEFSTFEMEDSFIPVAECYFSREFEQPLLIMEKVDTSRNRRPDYKDLPNWVGFVDGGQVGYDSKGRLVAYDL